jgi:hypothetical protein
MGAHAWSACRERMLGAHAWSTRLERLLGALDWKACLERQNEAHIWSTSSECGSACLERKQLHSLLEHELGARVGSREHKLGALFRERE